MVEGSDFSRSSQKAWRTIKKLDPETNHVRLAAPIEADEIAKDIKKRGTRQADPKFETRIRDSLRESKSSMPKRHDTLAAPLSPEEIGKAISGMGRGKAAGIDGVYPDMVAHLGPNARGWIAKAMTHDRRPRKR